METNMNNIQTVNTELEVNINIAKAGIWTRAKATANPKAYILNTKYMDAQTLETRAYNQALAKAKRWAKAKPEAKPEPVQEPVQEQVQEPELQIVGTKLELRARAKANGLKVRGTKQELINRLRDHILNVAPAA